ncbi:hypothetical protein ACFE04_004488 [Oxalis oulophora]
MASLMVVALVDMSNAFPKSSMDSYETALKCKGESASSPILPNNHKDSALGSWSHEGSLEDGGHAIKRTKIDDLTIVVEIGGLFVDGLYSSPEYYNVEAAPSPVEMTVEKEIVASSSLYNVLANPLEVFAKVDVGVAAEAHLGPAGDNVEAEMAPNVGEVLTSSTFKGRANLEEGQASNPKTLGAGNTSLIFILSLRLSTILAWASILIGDVVEEVVTLDYDLTLAQVKAAMKKKFVAWDFVRGDEDHVSEFQHLLVGENHPRAMSEIESMLQVALHHIRGQATPTDLKVKDTNSLISVVRDVEAVYARAEGDASSASSLVIERYQALATMKAEIEVMRVENESLKKYLSKAQASPIVVKSLKKENSRLHKLGVRSIWEKYYQQARDVVYVIDVASPSKFEDSKLALGKLLQHEDLHGAPLLILANEHVKSTCWKMLHSKKYEI